MAKPPDSIARAIGGRRYARGQKKVPRPPRSAITKGRANPVRKPPRPVTTKGPGGTPPVDPVITAIAQPAPQTGPYAGAPGSEAQHPGQQRTPLPDWADPNSPNYERRNYYIHPVTGEIVNREPGYYNPENPWDTGRPNETQGELARTYGYGADAIAPYERRMDEPGVTPWGPGGKPGATQPVRRDNGPVTLGGMPDLPRALTSKTSAAADFARYGNEDLARFDAGDQGDKLLELLRALIPLGLGRQGTMAPRGPVRRA